MCGSINNLMGKMNQYEGTSHNLSYRRKNRVRVFSTTTNNRARDNVGT